MTPRGCPRIGVKECGAQDFVRGYANYHLCECEIMDYPRLRPGETYRHGGPHRCGECGRYFTLIIPVDMSGLPGAP